MDVICPRCGEPWDFDTLHEETEARFDERHPDFRHQDPATKLAMRAEYERIFSDVAGEFRSAGCIALRSVRGTDEPCVKSRSMRTAMAVAVYEACGDDMDGAASMLEDISRAKG